MLMQLSVSEEFLAQVDKKHWLRVQLLYLYNGPVTVSVVELDVNLT